MTYREACQHIETIGELVEAILSGHPAPMKRLSDESPMEADELRDILGMSAGATVAEKVTGGERVAEQDRILSSVERFTRALDAIGGWGAVVRSVAVLAELDPAIVPMVGDHARMIRRGGAWHPGDGGMLEKVAARHGVDASTVQRRRKTLVREVARGAVAGV